MKSIKCSDCGLTNWSTVDTCKRCGAALTGEALPFESRPSERVSYRNVDSQQPANYPPPPQMKDERLVPFGVLLIILGGIITALHLGASMRGADFPLYFLILGIGILASGVVFCMKNWAAVYVYFLGYGLAAIVMLLTEEAVRNPLSRLAGPALLGLFLLNKMLKAKKSSSIQYAGQG